VFTRLFAVLAGTSMMLAAQAPDLAAKIYADSSKSVFLLIVKSEKGEAIAQGTGFLVSGGKIVTNQHVTSGGSVFIDLGAAKIPAMVERVDAVNDLALLTPAVVLEAKPLVIAEGLPTPGTNVYAIGNPAGLERSISTGVVSGIRQMSGRQLIQITSPISPGSSGGPILNNRGEVLGVAVGILESGQNLNFAVPAFAVMTLLRGKPLDDPADAPSLIETVESLRSERKELKYSSEPDSPYQKLGNQIRETASTAIGRAGKLQVELLHRVSKEFASTFDSADADIAVFAADRAMQMRASSETSLALAKALSWRSIFASDTEQKTFVDRAEKTARQAVSLAKQPDPDLYYTLGDILEMQQSHTEADTVLRRALELNQKTQNTEERYNILRDLIGAADGLKRPTDVDKWFEALTKTGNASGFDWEGQARRLDGASRYSEAGAAWQQATSMNGTWSDWCEAAGSYALSGGKEDLVLYDARKCIADGSGKPKSETNLAEVHRLVANVLNDRGVYEEALSHAKESTVLSP